MTSECGVATFLTHPGCQIEALFLRNSSICPPLQGIHAFSRTDAQRLVALSAGVRSFGGTRWRSRFVLVTHIDSRRRAGRGASAFAVAIWRISMPASRG